ncbi:MAG: hypothetical protein BWZ03_00487 [bacterium ADurb.BinA186]|nr:MAG: hypothetical protein BWZ03_00487 [bacterium ADurb.BinA186]
MIKLGKFSEVELRDVWANEATDFTQWLAKPENIQEINEAVGLDIDPETIQTEVPVGNYRCDILATDSLNGRKVLIENQLESSDHDHLGKIITYASGLQASVIVWIVKEANPEHASAIEWLNDHSDGTISFFLLEAHLYRIGDSEPALRLEKIEEPNDFELSVKESNDSPLNDVQKSRIEFWSLLNETLEQGKQFHVRKATPDHWYDFSVGSSQYHLSMELINKDGYLRVSAWIPNNKDLYDAFKSHQSEIESMVGVPLIWDRIDYGKGARISYQISGLDLGNKNCYQGLIDKGLSILVKMKPAFRKFEI